MSVVVHLTSSRFFGGPERQMLELASALPSPYRCAFASFSEDGHCEDLLDECGKRVSPVSRFSTIRLISLRGA